MCKDKLTHSTLPTQANHSTLLTQLSLPPSPPLQRFIHTHTHTHTAPSIAVALATVVLVQAGTDPSAERERAGVVLSTEAYKYSVKDLRWRTHLCHHLESALPEKTLKTHANSHLSGKTSYRAGLGHSLFKCRETHQFGNKCMTQHPQLYLI